MPPPPRRPCPPPPAQVTLRTLEVAAAHAAPHRAAPPPAAQVTLRTLEVAAAGRPLDVTVAAAPLAEGDVALSVPDELVVTVDRIVQSEALGALFNAAASCVCFV